MPRFFVLCTAAVFLAGVVSLVPGSGLVAAAAPACYTSDGDAFLKRQHDGMVRSYRTGDYNGALTQAQQLASNVKACIERHNWDSNEHINNYFTWYAVSMEYAGLVRKRQGDNKRARYDFEAARTQWQNLADETNSTVGQIALARRGIAWAERHLSALPPASAGTASAGTHGSAPAGSAPSGSATAGIAAPAGAKCLGFSGTWETEFGKMQISVRGTRGFARYVDPQGDTNTLSGTVEDGVFQGRFREPNRGSGTFRFEVVGETFFGTYEYDGRAASGTWHGRCLAATPPLQPPPVVRAKPQGCSSPVGTWNWWDELKVTFKPDGTSTNSVGHTGNWERLSPGKYHVHWDYPSDDYFTILPDGKTMPGTYNGNKGTSRRASC